MVQAVAVGLTAEFFVLPGVEDELVPEEVHRP
jgi:hypothetical protein